MQIQTLVLSLLAAVGQTPAPPAAAPQERRPDFTETVTNVLAPTTVVDKDGAIVNGLKISDFVLFDNDKQQRIQGDIVFQPISLVVAIQANAQVDQMIPKIRKIGGELDALVLGDSGEAAVIAFDHRIQVLQDFTSEKGKIDAAIKKISVYGSSQSRLNDAAMQAMNMLRNRPKTRRRILLLIAETRDGSSAARPRDVLLQAQFSDVLIYSVNISHWIAALTRTPATPRPDPIPPEARHVPGGGVMTPNDQSQMQLGNVLPAFVEVFRATKGIFVKNPTELYTKYTGGKEYTFMSQRSLDQAISDIGEEIHSQYLLSYVPSSKEGGYHTIKVEVLGRPNLKVRTRPGYWVAGPAEN
jgi:VWFA-related protein